MNREGAVRAEYIFRSFWDLFSSHQVPFKYAKVIFPRCNEKNSVNVNILGAARPVQVVVWLGQEEKQEYLGL